MARKLGDWLDNYLLYTSHTEAPEIYRKWTGISVMAAVLGRKCFTNWRREPLYPNLYVVLVGPTSARKGTAITQGLRFLQEPGLNIHLGVDSTSRASFIRDLKDSQETYIDAKGIMNIHSSLTLVSGEFTVFLGYKDLQLLTDLIDWYDTVKNPWIHKTISGNIQAIPGVWLNILGATTPDLLKSALPLEAIGGGLIGRLILLYAPRRAQKVPDDLETSEEALLKDQLLSDLMQMSMLGGPIKVSIKALDLYTEWYATFDEETECKDVRFSGYFSRKATTLIKLSMVLSASRTDDKVISVQDVERALMLLHEMEQQMYWALQGIGRNQFADVMGKIMAELMRVKECHLSDLMYKFRDDVSRFELDKVMQSLETMRFCTVMLGSGKIKVNEGFYNGQVH